VTAQSRLVLRVTIAFSIVCGLAIVTVATASAPKVTATVVTKSPTARVVHIVNHGRVTYRDFIVESKNAPKILSATKPCGRVQRDGNFNGSKFNWRYRAECKKTLAPGKSFTIGLKTSGGGGKIVVYVDVNDDLIPITK
jgi:hypothetical protein